MTASASDKARKSFSYLQKTLAGGGIDDNDTVLTPNNVTNIPTDTGVSFVIDRVDSNGTQTPTLRELMTGVVSGGTITNLSRGEQGTTAQAHIAGAVIEFVNSGELWNDLIDFMLQDHSNPSGYHKTLSDENGNEWIEQAATGSAVNHVLVRNAATGNNPRVEAAGDNTNIGLSHKTKGTGEHLFLDGSGNEIVNFGYVASAVNFLEFDPSATGQPLTVTASGDDSNVDIKLIPKGTGRVKNAAGGTIDGYEYLGSGTISSPGDTTTVTIAARRWLKFKIQAIGSGTIGINLRFNGDTGNNYCYGRTLDGAATTTVETQAQMALTPTFSTQRFVVLEGCNYATEEKIFTGPFLSGGNTGAAGVVSIGQTGGKWTNTSNQITSVTMLNASGGDFAAGTEIVIYGHN